jgi:hypothetical protein
VPEVGLEPTLPGGNRIFESLWGPVEGPCVTFASATSTGGYPAYLSPFSPFFPSSIRHNTREVLGPYSPYTGSGCRQNCRQKSRGRYAGCGSKAVLSMREPASTRRGKEVFEAGQR